jgi:hypothetical protein
LSININKKVSNVIIKINDTIKNKSKSGGKKNDIIVINENVMKVRHLIKVFLKGNFITNKRVISRLNTIKFFDNNTICIKEGNNLPLFKVFSPVNISNNTTLNNFNWIK